MTESSAEREDNFEIFFVEKKNTECTQRIKNIIKIMVSKC
jgi:hypothetical protein